MSTKNQQIWGQLWGAWQQRPPNAESCGKWPTNGEISAWTNVESGLKIMNYAYHIMISWLFFFLFHMLFVFFQCFFLHSLKNIHLKFALQQACWCLTNFTASAAASSSIAYGINKVPLTHALLILLLLLGVKLLVSSHVSPPFHFSKRSVEFFITCLLRFTVHCRNDGWWPWWKPQSDVVSDWSLGAEFKACF